MTRKTITRWWLWGLLAMAAAGVLIPSSSLALAAHDEGVNDAYSRTMVALIALGGAFALGSLLAQMVAWAGAVLNTRPLADTRWFQALLWGGVVGMLTVPLFGLGVLILLNLMVAYLVAGPDGLAVQTRPTAPAKSTINRWGVLGFATVGSGMLVALVVANLTDPGRLLHGVLWPSLAIESLGIAVGAVGGIAVCAAWWGALFNANLLTDRTWFKRLLWSGIAAAVTMPLFGLAALILAVVLIAYGRSAPDGLAVRPPRTPTTPSRLVPTH